MIIIFMERIKTFIPGLDEITGGGFPKSDSISLGGPVGSGKTIFSLQFLLKSGEPSIYVSFEHDINIIKQTALEFGWYNSNSNVFRMLRYDPFKIEDILDVIQNNIEEMKAQRIVIDSLSSLQLHINDKAEISSFILSIDKILRSSNCTALLISEIPSESDESGFGMEKFVTDDVIILHKKLIENEYKRFIEITKIRGGAHSLKLHPYAIDNSGFKILI